MTRSCTDTICPNHHFRAWGYCYVCGEYLHAPPPPPPAVPAQGVISQSRRESIQPGKRLTCSETGERCNYYLCDEFGCAKQPPMQRDPAVLADLIERAFTAAADDKDDVRMLLRASELIARNVNTIVKVLRDTGSETKRTIPAMPLFKAMRDQRDELADVLREVFDARGQDQTFHDGTVLVKREWIERASAAVLKVPTYEQRLRNIAEGIGMTYEELREALAHVG